MGPRTAWLSIVAGCCAAVAAGCARRDNPETCRINDECVRDGLMYRCDVRAYSCAWQRGPVGGACATSAGCLAGDAALPICTDGLCGWCTAAADPDLECATLNPATPGCRLDTGQCVTCTRNAHCPTDAPICDGNTCRTCREDRECEGRPGIFTPPICADLNGTCVPEGGAIVVEDKPGCVNETGPGFGTNATPLCQAQLGFDQHLVPSEPRGVIVLRGDLSSVNLNQLFGSPVLVVGQSAARLTTTTPYVIRIENGVSMVFRDILVEVGAGRTGIRLNNAGVVWLHAVRVLGQPGSGTGVSIQNADVRIDRSLIMGNDGGGISTVQTRYRITNTIIARNGSVGATLGTPINAADDLRFVNNTVVGNAITCAPSHPLKSSIIYNGGLPAVSGCALQTSTTDDPHLDATFHLTAASLSQIDMADPSDYPAGDFDSVIGRTPPPGGKPDIGADEYHP